MAVVSMSGNIIHSDADAIVNPVNCVGVMGKGLALTFKQTFPDMFREYVQMCRDGRIAIGKPAIHDMGHVYIVSFPTKNHWKEPSQYAYIDLGLAAMGELIDTYDIHSVAFPRIGCGLGGLDWAVVREKIVSASADWPCDVLLYEGR